MTKPRQNNVAIYARVLAYVVCMSYLNMSANAFAVSIDRLPIAANEMSTHGCRADQGEESQS